MRRVLVLRSGLGPASRHSRAGVAGLLDLSVRQVTHIEPAAACTGLQDARAPHGLRRVGRAARDGAPRLRRHPRGRRAELRVRDHEQRPRGHAVRRRGRPRPPHADAAAPSSQSDASAGSGGVLGESADQAPPAAIALLARPGDGDYTFVVMVLRRSWSPSGRASSRSAARSADLDERVGPADGGGRTLAGDMTARAVIPIGLSGGAALVLLAPAPRALAQDQPNATSGGG